MSRESRKDIIAMHLYSYTQETIKNGNDYKIPRGIFRHACIINDSVNTVIYESTTLPPSEIRGGGEKKSQCP